MLQSPSRLGAEATGDFLAEFHHPRILLGQIVGERHVGVGEEAQHILLAGAETQQQIVADPSPLAATAMGLHGGADQFWLVLMEGEARGENGREVKKWKRPRTH